jgi:hypothetical protein
MMKLIVLALALLAASCSAFMCATSSAFSGSALIQARTAAPSSKLRAQCGACCRCYAFYMHLVASNRVQFEGAATSTHQRCSAAALSNETSM